MSEPLPIEVSALAAAQVRAAEMWWRDNRPKAPGAIRTELERASSLIALQPPIGTRARNIALHGVRRLRRFWLFGMRAGQASPQVDEPPKQALARFSSCVVQSGIELPYQAVRYQIADAIHLVLHLGRHEGRRMVRELIRIGRYDVDRDRYERDELFSSGECRPRSIGGHA